MPKKSNVKDPNAPKKPLTAYFLWLKDNRARITQTGMTAPQVAKAAGVEWNALTDKTHWTKLAQQEKQRYEQEMQHYNQLSK
ncbi:HMG (high mobility group) box domain-containing protein [Ditylenchus destructor]|uniref:HMG (High mobility group) box domain-containing protein n=1 Tax=Ditylenchus destructor TaxID=166010 RepID=A0AAD4N4T6_9BILA|nr:HMG (high mobility group) box domain-containing protein [Ditylenchus destructor]